MARVGTNSSETLRATGYWAPGTFLGIPIWTPKYETDVYGRGSNDTVIGADRNDRTLWRNRQ